MEKVLASIFLVAGLFVIKVCTDSDVSHSVLIPTISTFSPRSGAAGTEVKLIGTNFSTIVSENTVCFSGKLAIVSTASSTLLTVKVPESATRGRIMVKVGEQSATSSSDFIIATTLGKARE
ncbi:hypothetical protein FNH22_14920 [Fulvivirga sp. M361]|uniref:IPT/TIG domain-containing protein n=1 Tax=Fulvivirga sp. M361 TaxID=2594266 RepID=UPI00117B5C3B|nr:IPT/TIG domain-containing protein [Fulvivirga sp. M361]TRX57701.1 hypothetical protein FNH22_14920 [Fulvivirga sp. M361]